MRLKANKHFSKFTCEQIRIYEMCLRTNIHSTKYAYERIYILRLWVKCCKLNPLYEEPR